MPSERGKEIRVRENGVTLRKKPPITSSFQQSRNPGVEKHRPTGRFWMPAFAGMTEFLLAGALS